MKILALAIVSLLLPALAGAVFTANVHNNFDAAEKLSSSNVQNVIVSSNMSGPNAEVEQLYDPVNGAIYEAWIANYSIGIAYSSDGGNVFKGQQVLPGSSFIPGTPQYSWDPSIALFSNGTIAVAFMHEFQNYSISPVVDLSFDGGLSFPVSSVVNPCNNSSFSDRDFIAISSNGTMYVTWNYAPSYSSVGIICPPSASCYYTSGDFNGVISYSSNLGKTWTKPEAFSPGYPYGGVVAAPIEIAPNGTLMILYEAYNMSYNHSLEKGYNYFTESADGGVSWSPRVLVGNWNGYIPNTVWWIDGALSIGNDGTIYASYDNVVNGIDYPYLSYSTNNGNNWTTVRVSDSSTEYAHIIQPEAGPAGTVMVGWVTNSSLPGLSPFVRLFSSVAGEFLTPVVRMSGNYGLNGVWGGDTIGVGMLPGNRATVSWGQQTPGTGNPEIYFSSSAFYNITFVEYGLPAGTSWFINVSGFSFHGTSGSNITIEMPDGTAAYSVGAVNAPYYSAGGVFNVNGAGIVISVTFSSDTYHVTFLEHSLQSGTNWSVTLNSKTLSSQNGSITFLVGNGSYSYFIGSPARYYSITPNGTLTVAGQELAVNIYFEKYAYLAGNVTPANASVYINGNKISTSTGTFNVSLKNGTYEVKVVDAGYLTYYNNVTVRSGHTKYLNIALKSSESSKGIPFTDIAMISGIVAAAVITVIASYYMIRKRK